MLYPSAQKKKPRRRKWTATKQQLHLTISTVLYYAEQYEISGLATSEHCFEVRTASGMTTGSEKPRISPHKYDAYPTAKERN
jgi:hypothetical protein